METFAGCASSPVCADEERAAGLPLFSAALAIHKAPRTANPKTKSATPRPPRREPARRVCLAFCAETLFFLASERLMSGSRLRYFFLLAAWFLPNARTYATSALI